MVRPAASRSTSPIAVNWQSFDLPERFDSFQTHSSFGWLCKQNEINKKRARDKVLEPKEFSFRFVERTTKVYWQTRTSLIGTAIWYCISWGLMCAVISSFFLKLQIDTFKSIFTLKWFYNCFFGLTKKQLDLVYNSVSSFTEQLKYFQRRIIPVKLCIHWGVSR